MAIGLAAGILGAVGAGTSILGGIFGAKAAKSAAQLQADAAAAAGAKVEKAVDATNSYVTDAAVQAGEGVKQAAGWAAGDAKATAATAKEDVNTAVTGANKILDPYATAGGTAADVLNKGIAAGGDFNKTPTMADIQIDPGYAWRQQQGEQALERSAAAHGAVGGGGFQKDLQDYIQGSASQEYQKAFQRFEDSTQNRFKNVSTVASEGRLAGTTQGANLIGGAKYGGDVTLDASKFGGALTTNAQEFASKAGIDATNLTTGRSIDAAKTAGDYTVQGANAQAAGKVASTNALWGGVGGAVNSFSNAYLLNNLMKNPSQNWIRNPSFPSGGYRAP